MLRFLRERFGFAPWMVTRTRGDDWIVLQGDDDGYDVRPGRVFRWQDICCHRMVEGGGPRVAPDGARVPAYVAAPIERPMPISACIGVPLTMPDGSLFGTLCATDPKQQPTEVEAEQALIDLLVPLLNGGLVMELGLADANRQSEGLATEAATDSLTRLANRRAWDDVLGHQEDRCRRYAHGAAIVVVDLDGLKDVDDTTAGLASGPAGRGGDGSVRRRAPQAHGEFRGGRSTYGPCCPNPDSDATAVFRDDLVVYVHDERFKGSMVARNSLVSVAGRCPSGLLT